VQFSTSTEYNLVSVPGLNVTHFNWGFAGIIISPRKSCKEPLVEHPSDLDGVGCSQNGMTCLLVLVMVPRPEKVE
jgi:hypothetical protein